VRDGGTYKETHMASAQTPLKGVAQAESTQHYFQQAKLTRDRSFFPHDAPQATVNGEDWPIPATREGSDSSDLEADIKPGVTGGREWMDMAER
jgi:hypothetical protein